MSMRALLNLLEAASRDPLGPAAQPADRFITAASHAITRNFGTPEDLHVRFVKRGPALVHVADDMQGQRTQRSWAILRRLTELARQYGVTMNIQGAAGPRWR